MEATGIYHNYIANYSSLREKCDVIFIIGKKENYIFIIGKKENYIFIIGKKENYIFIEKITFTLN